MKMKKLFSLLLCMMLLLEILPMTTLAARGLDKGDYTHISVSGKPLSALKLGFYNVRTVIRPGSKPVLEISGPTGNSPKTYSIDINTAQKTVSWPEGNLVFTLVEGEKTDGAYDWANKSGTFGINSGTGDTSIAGSGNMVRLDTDYTNTIKRNRKFSITYRITDSNVEARDVVSDSISVVGITGTSFVFNNTNPPVILAKTETGKPDESARFDVELDLTYTGSGNTVAFTIEYKTVDGVTRTLECSTTIPKTEEYVEKDKDDDDDNKTDLDPLTPNIIVDSYDYGGGSVTAGEDFVLKLRLRNTSRTHSLVNIVMNVAPTGVFSMSSSSNTFFIDQLGPGNIIEREIIVKTGLTKVTDDKDSNAINLTFKFEFVNNANDKNLLVKGESSERITLPVAFPDRFELGIPEVSETYQGEESYLSVAMVNKGRSSVYNLTARIEGEGMANPGQSQFIGTVNAGTESTADFSVRYNEAGDFVGQIIVTYEDANENPKEAVAPFNISVMENGGGEMPPMEEPMPPEIPADVEPEDDPILPVMIAVGAIVCLMSAYVTIQKAKLKRSLFTDEDI